MTLCLGRDHGRGRGRGRGRGHGSAPACRHGGCHADRLRGQVYRHHPHGGCRHDGCHRHAVHRAHVHAPGHDHDHDHARDHVHSGRPQSHAGAPLLPYHHPVDCPAAASPLDAHHRRHHHWLQPACGRYDHHDDAQDHRQRRWRKDGPSCRHRSRMQDGGTNRRVARPTQSRQSRPNPQQQLLLERAQAVAGRLSDPSSDHAHAPAASAADRRPLPDCQNGRHPAAGAPAVADSHLVSSASGHLLRAQPQQADPLRRLREHRARLPHANPFRQRRLPLCGDSRGRHVAHRDRAEVNALLLHLLRHHASLAGAAPVVLAPPSTGTA